MSSLMQQPLLSASHARLGTNLAAAVFVALGFGSLVVPERWTNAFGLAAFVKQTPAAASTAVSSSRPLNSAQEIPPTSPWLAVIGQRMLSEGLLGLAIAREGNVRLMGLWMALVAAPAPFVDGVIATVWSRDPKNATSHTVFGVVFAGLAAGMLLKR